MKQTYDPAFSCPMAATGLFIPGRPFRGVLHKTEGDFAAGAVATYRKTGNYPHFTVGPEGVYRHLPLNMYATALEHRPGTIDTNRMAAIQIEIVGYSAKPTDPSTLAHLVPLMRWIELQTGIGNYYVQLRDRFTDESWRTYNGWCGHVHVPNNNHTDPGNIELDVLFPINDSPQPITVLQAPTFTEPDMPAYADKYDWDDGASVKVYPNGEVYAYGAKDWGNMDQIADHFKLGFEQARSIRPVDPKDSQAGYIIGDKTEWAFKAGTKEAFFKP